MKKILENIEKQFKRWLNNQRKSQLYKDYDSKEYDKFAHGYATGWVKALQAFKGWLSEFGECGIFDKIESEIRRMNDLLDRDYAYLYEGEKKSKRESYNEILSVIENIRKEHE